MCLQANEVNNATVAQSVEQLIRNQQVAGSSPASSSNTLSAKRWGYNYMIDKGETTA